MFNIALSMYVNINFEQYRTERQFLIKQLVFVIDYITKINLSDFIENKTKIFILFKFLNLILLLNKQIIYCRDLALILKGVR